jgi:hypothetical protein
MKKLNGILGMALSMAMMSETNFGRDSEPMKFAPPKPFKKVIPKGCKEYWFFKSDGFANEKPNASYEVVYECIASSDKKAIEKFNNWKNK